DRTGCRPHPCGGAGGAGGIAGPSRLQLGCAAVRARARRCRAARRRHAGSAPPAASSRPHRRRAADAGQQQLRRGRQPHQRRPRHRRRRHAPGPARAQYLVPRTPALPGHQRARRQGGCHRFHPARLAGGGGRQQRACGLGLYQQLHPHRRLCADCAVHAGSSANAHHPCRNHSRGRRRAGAFCGARERLGTDPARQPRWQPARAALGRAAARREPAGLCADEYGGRCAGRLCSGRSLGHSGTEPVAGRSQRAHRLAVDRCAPGTQCRLWPGRHRRTGKLGAGCGRGIAFAYGNGGASAGRLPALAGAQRRCSRPDRSSVAPALDRQQPRRRCAAVGHARQCRLRPGCACAADPRRLVRQAALQRAGPARHPARRSRRAAHAVVAVVAQRGRAQQGPGLAADRSRHPAVGRARIHPLGQLSHRARLSRHDHRRSGSRPAGAGKSRAWQGLPAAASRPAGRHRLAVAAAAPGASAAARLCELGSAACRGCTQCADGSRCAGRRLERTYLGRTQHRRHLPPDRAGIACACKALAVHAARPTARRSRHAARARPGLRCLRTHGGVARPRTGRHRAHAGRPERTPLVAVLGRRPRRLGTRPADPVPADRNPLHAAIAAEI
ncbi:hypothetical protein XPR_3368, partial [Xanthomonas arboricola pv. pruni MAFF 301420]